MGHLPSFLNRSRPWRSVVLLAAAFLLPLPARAAPIDVPPLNFPKPATPPLGVNLESVDDSSRCMMFTDLMKAARKFGTADEPWDEKAPVGPDGWPTGDAGTVLLTNTDVQPGDYLFSCTGRCELSAPVTNAKLKSTGYDRAKNLTVAVLTVNPGCDHLFVAFKKTNGGIKNIRLLRPGYPLASKEVFTREFLKAIEPFSALRFMDPLRTNTSDASEWKDRTLPTAPTQSGPRGIAWEYVIQLANETNKDPWINIPVLATDDYIKQLAQLFKEKLNKDRNVYIEYSNEMWNATFFQYGKNIELAEKEVASGNPALKDNDPDNNKYYWGWRRTAQRLVQISQIFRDAFGADAARIRPVLASQVAYSFVVKMQLDYIDHHFGPPARFIYGIAGAPYLNLGDKYRDKDDLTVDQIISPAFEESLISNKQGNREYQSLAAWHRIHALCYEGGIDLEGDHSTQAKIDANKDPRMQAIAEKYMNNWYAQGGGLFMYYTLAGTYSKFGCWGLTDDIRRLNEPKMRAAIAVAAEPMPPLTVGAPVPGKWNAADQITSSSGGRLEDTGSGNKCIASLGDKDLVDFLLNIQQEGNYSLTIQTACAADGAHLEALISGQSLGTLPCPNTGGWHTFTDNPPILLHLSAGQLTLRLRAIGRAPNIGTITFTPQ